MQVRQRSCMCPSASAGGQDCDGENFQVRECENVPPCHPDFNIRTIDKETHLSSAKDGSEDVSEDTGDQEEKAGETDETSQPPPSKVTVN